jgi:hypothetical protein
MDVLDARREQAARPVGEARDNFFVGGSSERVLIDDYARRWSARSFVATMPCSDEEKYHTIAIGHGYEPEPNWLQAPLNRSKAIPSATLRSPAFPTRGRSALPERGRRPD